MRTTPSVTAMMAFARLVGHVRFFHPSDSVVATNWHAFLIHRAKGNVSLEASPCLFSGS